MNINFFLKNKYTNIMIKHGRHLKHQAKDIDIYVNNFPEPEDDIQRSFFQYKCQKWDDMTFLMSIVLDLCAAFLIIPQFISFTG